MTKSEVVEKNITSMIQLLSGLIEATSSGDAGETTSDVALFITNDLCLRLLNIILTGHPESGLEKRDSLQKRRKDSKKATLPLTEEQLYSMFGILRTVLRSKCNLH